MFQMVRKIGQKIIRTAIRSPAGRAIAEMPSPKACSTKMRSKSGKLALQALLIWGAWTVFAFFSASQGYISRAYAGGKPEWQPVILYGLLDSYVWAFVDAADFSSRRTPGSTPVQLVVDGAAVAGDQPSFALLHLRLRTRAAMDWVSHQSQDDPTMLTAGCIRTC